jgi:anaerobic magnesium-protoporphyrin IX monomethyl ester cyclase
MKDCLLIGWNEYNYENYIRMIRSIGEERAPYRDLSLGFVEYQGRAYRLLDLINEFSNIEKEKKLHNGDFLWPAILYLGTYLTKHGYTFDYINNVHLEKEKLNEKLYQNDYLTIVITTTLTVIPHPILEIIQQIRKHLKNNKNNSKNTHTKIILGGPYILNQAFKEMYNIKDDSTGDNKQLLNFFNLMGADYYVINIEGEKALVQIIQALKKGTSCDAIDNIAFKKESQFLLTRTSNEFNPLETNMVNYDLFPKEAYGNFLLTRTTKSCPFQCAFCDFSLKAGKYTFLSTDLVEKELDQIAKIGTIKDISFIDDTFNVPKERFKEILRMMIKNQYPFKWNSYLRCSHLDEEVVGLLKESGCEGVFLGIESGSNTILEQMNKKSTSEINKKYIQLLNKEGIITHANFIVGFPGETDFTIKETMAFIEESSPDFFRAQLWYADPITPIWKRKEELKINGAFFEWTHQTMDSITACNHIEQLFLNIQNSQWLPQWGFELWSVFYLQHQGVPITSIKTMISHFNTAIKQKLKDKTQKELNPQLAEQFKNLCLQSIQATA